MKKQKQILTVAVVLALGGCTTYRPKPLSTSIALPEKPDQLIGAKSVFRKAGNTAPLSMQQLTTLALYNNPELKASRVKLKVAGAQLYAAGLFPDPSLSMNVDNPMGNSAGLVNAWGLGLGYDLLSLITRQAQLDIQSSLKKQVSLELLWQEWQVVQQVRSQAVRLITERKQLALLKETFNLYQQRYAKSSKALAAGDITLDVNGTNLTAFVDISSQINQLEQTHNETRHTLNQLLGLSPKVDLNLQKLPKILILDPARIKAQLAILAKHRPDLMALQAAYRGQEARVHSAILSQFPSLGIGINRAKDTAGLHTAGLSISLNLPFLSGNRGAIAVERATREQLRAEFKARLAQTAIDVDKLIALESILVKQQKLLQHYLPQLSKLAENARKAYRQGEIDALTFLTLETTWINKRLELISLDQLRRETAIALQTMLAVPSLTNPGSHQITPAAKLKRPR